MMSLAELILFIALIAGVYFALRPVQRKLENWILSLMGRAPGRKGQGNIYKIKGKDRE